MNQKKLTTILIVLFVMVALFSALRVSQYYAPTGYAAVQTNLTVNGTCTLNLNVTNLTFGQTNPNSTYTADNISVNFSNTGNTPQNVSINSSHFFVNATVGENAAPLSCNQTRYSNWTTPPQTAWDAQVSGICRGSTITTINRIQENQSFAPVAGKTFYDNNTTFKINIPAGVPQGVYQQNISFYAEC